MGAFTGRRAGARWWSGALLGIGLACSALSLQGCGGGGGGGGGGGSSSSSGGGSSSSSSSGSSSSSSSGGSGSFTIGGSVSGLTGTGLTLLDNGGNSLSVPANATSFVFSVPINSGQPYAVTVSAQPTNPAENCSVSGGSGTVGSAAVTSVAVSCVAASNVAAITLDSFNGNSGGNTPYVTVTICAPGSTTNCQTIDHITVDTGSFGLRILASAITNAGLLAALPNVNGSTGPFLAECQQFGSGYTWGSVRTVDFSIPNTSEAVSGLPVQIIGDMEPAPSLCQTQAVTSGQQLGNSGYSTPANFGANGLIGIGPFPQDCGQCVSTPKPSSGGTAYLIYTNCTTMTSSSCSTNGTTVPLNQQVINPVADFGVDNTGIIIQLPAVSTVLGGNGLYGVATVSGTLTFGIVPGSVGNNALGNATVYLADPSTGYVTTVYKGVTDTNSYIDSGSNGLYFDDSSQTLCTPSKPSDSFYCPGGANASGAAGTSISESATFEDYNGQHGTPISFVVENANLTNVDAVGLAGTGTSNEFDWGVPFLYGRKVYTALGYDATGNPLSVGNYAAPFYAF